MIAEVTYFTLLLDMQNSMRPMLGTFIENVSRSIPPSGCRIRMSAYGAYKISEAPKLLIGRYVLTGEELRRQWSAVAKATTTCGIKRLEATLAALFKSDGVGKNAKRVCVIVSSVNWSAYPSCMAAIAPTCASGVEVQFVSPNNAEAVVALMRTHIKSRRPAGNVVTHGFTPAANPQELSSFNNIVVDGLQRFQREIDISRFLRTIAKGGCGWREEELVERYHDVLWNNPLLFHVTKSFGVKTSRLESTGEIVHAFLVNAPFVGSVSSYRAQRQRVERAAAIAMKTIVGITNVVEKVKRLHDYLSANCQYSVVSYGNKTMKYRTVYDALVCGQAVCEGFTIAFRYLLLLAGIESREIVSDVMHHCWNYVRLGGNWYHVDVTFDNPVVEGVTAGTPKHMSHEFFLLSDAALLAKGKHHDWDRQHLPPATDTRFDRVKWE